MKSKLLVLLVMIMIALCLPRPRTAYALSGGTASPCVVGHTEPRSGFWTWPSNSQVNVYLRKPDFSLVDVAAVEVAVRNWDQSATENGSNVRFTVKGLTQETKTARGDLTLVRGEVFDKQLRHLAFLEAHSLKVNQLIDYALVIVDSKVKNPQVLTNVIAHELGHSLGLLDCVKCSSGSTAMGLMRGDGSSNGIEGPTACDKVGVGTAYRELLARVGPAPADLRLGKTPVDEGEEPEDDDTLVVVRKPWE